MINGDRWGYLLGLFLRLLHLAANPFKEYPIFPNADNNHSQSRIISPLMTLSEDKELCEAVRLSNFPADETKLMVLSTILVSLCDPTTSKKSGCSKYLCN